MKKSLKNRIKFGNEFSLRKRLIDICDKHGKNIGTFIKNDTSFVGKIIDTRNYLIHNSPELKNKACYGKELIMITYQIKLLLEICILRSLGFGEEEVNKLISKHERYQFDYIENRFVISSI